MAKYLKFLTGGGQMGALMRAYNWESSPIGMADKWPQSLLTTLGILINSKSPLFLFWGPQYVCFYNDAYCSILGNDSNNPEILGIKGETAWPEKWHIIKPLLDQVISNDEATSSEDQLIPIYGNGKMEDVNFTFNYSPVKDDSGMPAGVFVTSTETIEKVQTIKKLTESNNQLNFAIEAIKLVIWDYNPMTNKFNGNHHFKDWFGISNGEEFDIAIGMNLIVENDRNRVSDAFYKALEFESGGFYDIEYNIINPVTKQERIVSAKGKVWFGEDKKANRFIGTLQDITQKEIIRRKIEESEQHFCNIILQAPVLINTFIGPSFIVDSINKKALEIWGKSFEQVINKPFFDSSPELEEKVKKILNDVYTTGEPFISNEIPVQLKRLGKPYTAYFNTVYQPLLDLDNNIYGIIVIGTEVTETVNARKQTEENTAILKKEHELLQNYFIEAPAFFVILKGKEHVFEFANTMYHQLIGNRDILGKKMMEVLPELKGQGYDVIVDEIHRTGKSFIAREMPAFIEQEKGKLKQIYIDLHCQAIKNNEEYIEGILVFGYDVTELVIARKQFEESEKRFSNILSQSLMAIAILKGPEMMVAFANEPLIAIWGKGNNIIGKTLLEVMPEIKDQVFTKLITDVYTTGVPFASNEIKAIINRNEKNEECYFNLIFQPYRDVDDTITGVTMLGTEITEYVVAKDQIIESEKQFRIFADSIQNLAWIANGEGWIYFYNQQWYDYTGTTLEEMEGWGWEKVHHPDHVEKVVEFVKAAWRKDEAFELIFPLRRHDGEYRWFLTRAYPVKDANGKIERWIGTNTDIHEQKTKEQQKDEFISIASHEMKTPLTSAKGYLELLLPLLSEEDQTAFLYANKANQSVERLHRLVTELLDASKIQKGKLNYNLSTFDFNEMLIESIEDIQLTAKFHLIQKTGNYLKQITGDRDRLQQVLINLLSNAVKYSPKADKIVVKIEEQENEIQVSVQDFGVGMPSQHLDKIFERYYRVQEHAINFQGLGIGLYISKNIIERHKGTMWAESELDKGSTFYFTLPI